MVLIISTTFPFQETLLNRQRMEVESLIATQNFDKYDYNELLRKRYLRLRSKMNLWFA